mgnify:CR=1 FL=1
MKNILVKTGALVLALIMTVLVAGCGGDGSSNKPSNGKRPWLSQSK